MPPIVESRAAPPQAAAALVLAAVAALLLTACTTVRVGTIQRSHGPQIRARQVSVAFTKELP